MERRLPIRLPVLVLACLVLTIGTGAAIGYYGEVYNYGYYGNGDTYIYEGFTPAAYNPDNPYNRFLAEDSGAAVSRAGKYQIVTQAPLVNSFGQDYLSPDEYENNTWYVSGQETMPNVILLKVALDPSQNLSDLDIAVNYPRGKIVYAQNFQVREESGREILETDQYGMDTLEVGFSDPNVQSKHYIWDQRPLVLPERILGQKTILTIVIMDLGIDYDNVMGPFYGR